MKPKRAEKKNFLSKIQSVQLVLESLNDMIDRLYNDLFRVYRMSSTQVATEYLAGLLKCEKGHENMERMVEKVDNSDYKRYIHFLSVSSWSALDVNLATLKGADSNKRTEDKKPSANWFDI